MNPLPEVSAHDTTSMDYRIAVVGMSCRFPGGADDPESFWTLLKSGKCTMEDIPPSRFNIDDYWTEGDDLYNKMLTRKGHFLQEGTCFDEAFFNLSPREALNTDPQHRLMLETVVDALDDAGYKPVDEGGESGWVKSKMGIFVSLITDSYQNNLASNIDSFYPSGVIRGFASGRVSHYFQWQGPSIVFDTACASALQAVHSACQSLILNECNAALATGANMLTSPEMFIGLTKGYFVSNTGGCRTFDETADGYCRAEGAGVLVLKRYADAIRDKDNIHAIILASGTNHSGPAESLTKPHAPSQADLFALNLAKANISPLAITAVEVHGTGTQAGDRAEIEAIKIAYCRDRPPISSEAPDDDPSGTKLFVSALKPNIGHSESASGLASSIKAILQIQHRELLAHIGISTRRNPRLGNVEEHGIVIPSRNQPLKPVAGQERIIISVNNFGAPGGNSNIILQESIPPSDELPKDPRTHHVITVSAKTHTPFAVVVQRLIDHLENNPDMNLASLSYTTTARRMDYPTRLALSVTSIDDLKKQLQKSTAIPSRQSKSVPRIGFALGGNGSQHQGMGKILYEMSPVFREHIDICDTAFKKHGGPGVIGVIMGDVDPFGQEFESQVSSSASIFSVEYALGMLWKDWGITPSLLIGHSMGEFAALALAGCLSVDDAMKLTISKIASVYTEEVRNFDGGMLALGVSPDTARQLIDCSGSSGLEVCCFNGPAQSCVSGTKAELMKLQAFANSQPEPPLVKLMEGFVASHSSHLRKPAEMLAKTAESVTFRPAEIPMMLNTDGSVLQVGEVPARSYLADQMYAPVRFDLCASHARAQEIDIWIELSAKPIMIPLLRPFVPAGKVFLPTLGGRGTESWSFVAKALCRLYEAHVPINWAKYHRGYPVRLVSLPRYPFARNEHYVPYTDRLHHYTNAQLTKPAPASQEAPYDFISTPLGSLEVVSPWRKYLLHTGGHHLSPGAYLWLALSCTQSRRVSDLRVTHPGGAGAYLTILIGDDGSVSFVRHDLKHPSEDGLLVASCRIESGGAAADPETVKLLNRSKDRLARNPVSSFLNKVMVNKMLAASQDSFGSMSELAGYPLEKLTVSDDGEEGVGSVHWPGARISQDQLHASLSKVPFSPSELRALLQPACLMFFLSPASIPARGPYSIDVFEYAKELIEDRTFCSAHSLSVHVFLEMASSKSGRQTSSTKTYVSLEGGAPLVRIIGFRKSRGNALHTPVSIEVTREASSLSSPEMSSSTSSFALRTPSPVHLISEKAVPIVTDYLTAKPLDHIRPPPLPEQKPIPAEVTKATEEFVVTEAIIIAALAEELGIPPQTITLDDGLEDVGVDSIMSLLVRDKFSKLSGRRLKWFDWKTGMTVQDLWDFTTQAVQA